jgi:nicotinamide riboside kinase
MPRPLRITISGSAGTGKTVLGGRLAERLGLPFLPEGMRARIKAGLDLHVLSHAEHRALVQELYDESLAAMATAEVTHGGFVADRCPLDYLAFWLYYGFADDEPATAAFAERIAVDMACCDAVVVLPWGILPLESDGVRSPNRWRQLHFQGLFEGLARARVAPERLFWLPPTVTALEARVGWVVDAVVNGCLR